MPVVALTANLIRTATCPAGKGKVKISHHKALAETLQGRFCLQKCVLHHHVGLRSCNSRLELFSGLHSLSKVEQRLALASYLCSVNRSENQCLTGFHFYFQY